jgi:hypothetical protein
MYLQNKYTTVYNSIIARAQSRLLSKDVYSERHHIIPKSLGGTDLPINLVCLTAREHFICHWLLTKMVEGAAQQKMAYACKRMMTGHKDSRYRVTGRKYELLKQGMNNLLKGRKFTPEWISKLKESAQLRATRISDSERQQRRDAMIQKNKARKGEKRPWMTGENNNFYGKKFTGTLNGFYGKKHTEETLTKLRVPQPRISCIVCRKEIGGFTNLVCWHGDKCKHDK